ncbi:hypothetical protein RUM43_003132 [Polyplax serrata]|uniref:FLYWCH-type domain-containing protein n=1 Tax=Polyplax serrata TaxID=468196 RepID=A0AAN8S307_POLSC
MAPLHFWGLVWVGFSCGDRSKNEIDKSCYEIVRSKKGTFVIHYNGHRYGHVRNPKYPRKYWVCTSYQSSQCRARAVMMENGNLLLKECHSHLPKWC